jgi:hypothetical protein
MRFHDVEHAIAGIPSTTPWQGRRIYHHIRATGARDERSMLARRLELAARRGVGRR